MVSGIAHMAGLIVKEEIGLEFSQESAFGEATQKHGLIDINIPVHQGVQRPLMRWCAARRDQSGANAHARRLHLLQLVQRQQQGLERPGRQWLAGFLQLMALKGLQTFGLKNPLGLVREQYGVAVKGNAQFMRMIVAGAHGVGIDMGCRIAQVQGLGHILRIGGQKQLCAQWP